MRLILIRHGDPDYERDTLTEKGKREAALLAARAVSWQVDDVYVSPLGRAKDTARPCLEGWNKTAQTLDWAEEFILPEKNELGWNEIAWDYFPADWTAHRENFCEQDWLLCIPSGRERYQRVCSSLDGLLKTYGYERTGRYYRAVQPSGKTVVLFCHFGVSMMMLSHLLNIPAQTLLHGMYLPPTSVTVLNSEQRRGDEAYFRAERIGDCAHLIAGGEPISESGYFTTILQEPPIGRK